MLRKLNLGVYGLNKKYKDRGCRAYFKSIPHKDFSSSPILLSVCTHLDGQPSFMQKLRYFKIYYCCSRLTSVSNLPSKRFIGLMSKLKWVVTVGLSGVLLLFVQKCDSNTANNVNTVIIYQHTREQHPSMTTDTVANPLQEYLIVGSINGSEFWQDKLIF